MKRATQILAVIVVIALVAGCSGRSWQPPRVRLPKRGPVDIFVDIIDQVRGIGRSLSRQIQRMARGRR